VGGRPHLSPRVLPFTSVTHYLHGLLFILLTPEGWKGEWA